MPIRHTYKGNIILVYPRGDAWYFLFDSEGDINEYHAASLKDAQAAIDSFQKRTGGLYDADGNLLP